MSALLVFILAATSAVASDVGSWTNLRDLSGATAVEISTSAGKTLKGAFVSFSEESITIRTKQQEISTPRADVTRVRRRTGSKATWIGAGLGAGACAGIGYAGGEALANTSGGDFQPSGAFAAGGAAVGALAGAAIGHFIGNRNTLIYKWR